MDDIIRRTENRCKCKIPPEGLLIFIIRAIKYFREEQFLTKLSEKQFSLLIHIFEKCTNTEINQVIGSRKYYIHNGSTFLNFAMERKKYNCSWQCIQHFIIILMINPMLFAFMNHGLKQNKL